MMSPPSSPNSPLRGVNINQRDKYKVLGTINTRKLSTVETFTNVCWNRVKIGSQPMGYAGIAPQEVSGQRLYRQIWEQARLYRQIWEQADYTHFGFLGFLRNICISCRGKFKMQLIFGIKNSVLVNFRHSSYQRLALLQRLGLWL